MAVDKLVDSAQLDGYFTNIASAIRSKAGVSSTYTPSEMPQAIEDIPSGGGGDLEIYQSIVARTVSGIVSLSGLISVGYQGFASCSKIKELYLPDCMTVSAYAFGACRSMQTCIAPNIITIATNAFIDCRSLKEINLPKLGTVYNAAFTSCYSLSAASFENCTQIQSNAFSKCYNLLSLYLLGSQVASLANINAFASTPISNYTTSTGGVYGSIFVPTSLYDSYITKGNWSIYSDRFVSV